MTKLSHTVGIQYMVAATTTEVKTTGHIRATVVTLNHEVLDMNDSIRVDLCDHPLYKDLQSYVNNNPR